MRPIYCCDELTKAQNYVYEGLNGFAKEHKQTARLAGLALAPLDEVTELLKVPVTILESFALSIINGFGAIHSHAVGSDEYTFREALCFTQMAIVGTISIPVRVLFAPLKATYQAAVNVYDPESAKSINMGLFDDKTKRKEGLNLFEKIYFPQNAMYGFLNDASDHKVLSRLAGLLIVPIDLTMDIVVNVCLVAGLAFAIIVNTFGALYSLVGESNRCSFKGTILMAENTCLQISQVAAKVLMLPLTLPYQMLVNVWDPASAKSINDYNVFKHWHEAAEREEADSLRFI